MSSPDWVAIFRSGALERLGKKCATVRQLAHKIATEVQCDVSYEALKRAHRRHAPKMHLQPLASYIGLSLAGLPPATRAEDVRFPLSEARKRALHDARCVVVTSALNNCPLDGPTWESLQQYVAYRKAELVVLPIRYHNPTSRVDGRIIDANAWWPSEVLPCMADELIPLHRHCWIMGHVRIQATAARPLSGLEGLSRGASAVFAHGQLAMQTVATPQSRHAKILYTTGSCSRSQYSDTRAGIRGDFHHGLGGLVIELDGDDYHIRALVADDDGGFYDLDKYTSPSGVEDADEALALIPGDEHALFSDYQCRQATYGDGGICDRLRPQTIVRHDVFDSYSISHHHKGDLLQQIGAHERITLGRELLECVDYIDATTPDGAKNIIVASNHHDHLDRWLRRTNPIDDPLNARTWIALWGMVFPSIKQGPGGVTCTPALVAYLSEHVTSRCHFLDRDSDITIGGIAIGLHGDAGPNGTAGSRSAFSRIGVKTVIGHSHSPGIHHGCYQVGTSGSLKMAYQRGPSSWAHAHCVIYPNGKRQIIFVRDGKWRAV